MLFDSIWYLNTVFGNHRPYCRHSTENPFTRPVDFWRGNQKCKNANRFPGVGLTTLLRGTQLNRTYDRGPVIFKQYNSEMFDIISLSKSCCFVEQISIFIIKYFHNISMNPIFTKPIHLKTELSELSCAVPQTMVMNSPLNKMSRKYEITAMYFCLCSISMRSTG